MQGKQDFCSNFSGNIDIENFIPSNHLVRKFDKLIDLSFIREITSSFYCKDNGRSSIDPETYFRMQLISYFYGIRSERQLCEEVQVNLAYRWYCRFSINSPVPEHSSLTRIRKRLSEKTFQEIFNRIIIFYQNKGMVKGKRIISDASIIKANASLDSLVTTGDSKSAA